MKYIKAAHTVYRTQYHIVIVTKYRRKILVDGVEKYLKKKLEEVRKHYPEWRYIEVGIDKDHVHLHMMIPPKYAVSDVVRTLKINTGKKLRKKFDFINKVYWGVEGVWSDGYFVTTVGIDENIIKRYVAMQGREDAGQAELELD